MKHLYITIIGSVLLSPAMAQFSAGFGYQLSAPQGKMNKNINMAHSAAIFGLYQLPGNLKQFAVGVEAGVGTYAQKSMEQTFTFSNGSQTRTNVNYSSNMWQTSALFRYDLRKQSLITPYLNAKLGYTRLYANIRIDDPNDSDGCHPLDRKTLLSDGSFTAAGGIGFKLDMAALARSWDKGMGWIDFNVSYLTGGNVNYINTRKLSSAVTATSEGGKPLTAQFINASTQNIHEHQVAEVFNSPLRMLQAQISFFKTF